MPPLNVIQTTNLPILLQLRIEEALIRTNNENWCIINKGSPPAIVLGISGKPDELVCFEKWQKHPIPLIKRFSGGGTVVVDENTLFVSLLINQRDVDVHPYPKAIMEWSEQLYQPVFPNTSFSLKENDYVAGSHKFGGNAQYIRKNRWLHHTSFLWDYNPVLMNLLQLPTKRPNYRANRDHHAFLTKMKTFIKNQEVLTTRLIESINRHFNCSQRTIEDVRPLMDTEHRKSTCVVEGKWTTLKKTAERGLATYSSTL